MTKSTFEADIQAVLDTHGKGLPDLRDFATKAREEKRKERQRLRLDLQRNGRINKPRPLSIYLNPHTGEEVRTRGGNHKTLNAWRVKYGREEVSNWIQEMID